MGGSMVLKGNEHLMFAMTAAACFFMFFTNNN